MNTGPIEMAGGELSFGCFSAVTVNTRRLLVDGVFVGEEIGGAYGRLD